MPAIAVARRARALAALPVVLTGACTIGSVASLRPAARFPHGLTPELERRLLEATGRSATATVPQ